jgi:hypothetical protein
MENSIQHFITALPADDLAAAAAALQHSEVRDKISDGIFAYGRPPLLEARSGVQWRALTGWIA